MKVANARQIQELDRKAIEVLGIESLFLMENAGRAVAERAASILKNSKNRNIAVLCGTGNNGGDGFVAARYLINKGFKVKIFLLGLVKNITNDSRANLDLLNRLNQKVVEIANTKSFSKQKHDIRNGTLIIDALLGVGLKGEVREPARTAIDFLNRSKKTIISIDTPSGLDVTTGMPLGICITADETITFSLAKKGFFINQGPDFIGKLTVVDIGIPRHLIKQLK